MSRVGENWREAQARALLRASAHLVVLDDNMVHHSSARPDQAERDTRALEQRQAHIVHRFLVYI
jgi:hypothetical protein